MFYEDIYFAVRETLYASRIKRQCLLMLEVLNFFCFFYTGEKKILELHQQKAMCTERYRTEIIHFWCRFI